MAEEDLKKTILAKIRKEKEEILNQARREGGEILQQAKAEALSLRKGYESKIEKDCRLKKARELNRINLEIKRQLSIAKEKKVSRVLSEVERAIETIRKDRGRYKSIFRQLLYESLEGFGRDAKLRLKINPMDKDLASELSRELNVNVQLEAKDSIDAGLELCDLEESIIVLTTFDSRLKRLMSELRQEISNILFGQLTV